jgi:hypothetical protein
MTNLPRCTTCAQNPLWRLRFPMSEPVEADRWRLGRCLGLRIELIIDLRLMIIPDPSISPWRSAEDWRRPGCQPSAFRPRSLAGGSGPWALRQGYYQLRGYHGLDQGDVKLLVAAGAWTGAESLAPLPRLLSSWRGICRTNRLALPRDWRSALFSVSASSGSPCPRLSGSSP